MKEKIDSAQIDLDASIGKIDESTQLIDRVLNRIEDTEDSIDKLRGQQDKISRNLEKALEENRIENDTIITELKRLKPILVALRDKAKLYTIRRNP